MNISKILHQTASEYSTFAMIAKAKGQLEESKHFFKQAYELERTAVLQIQTDDTDPLFPFILKRSTAALAYKAGFYEIANKLVTDVLNENPPSFIAIELKEIADLVESAKEIQAQQKSIQINGKLTSASEAKHEIEVEDVKNKRHYVIGVSGDEIKGIVKKFFLEWVQVQVITEANGFLRLEQIKERR
ncbi:MAG: hypothetical protein ACPGVB_12655 [Chitinophagales bacterium]